MLTDLIKEHAATLEYLISKIPNKDWHGISDACNDLREIEARIQTIELCRAQQIADGTIPPPGPIVRAGDPLPYKVEIIQDAKRTGQVKVE